MRPFGDSVDADEQPGVDEATWEPEAAGFPLVVSGLIAFLLGIAAALWAQAAPGMAKYAWREVAGVAVGVAMPLFLLGIHVAFPTRRGSRVAAMTGLGLAVAGIAIFVYLYPYNWNVRGRDGSPWGLVPYASGILFMGGAALMSLLDAFLDVRAGHPVGTRAHAAEADVTPEEIARDLANAGRSKLTWGGIQSTSGPKLRVNMQSTATVLKGRVGTRHVLEDLGVQPEVSRLQAFRGSTVRASEDVEDGDDPAAVLLALRTSRAEEERIARESTLLNRIMGQMRTFFSPWEDPAAAPGGSGKSPGEVVTFTIVEANRLESSAPPPSGATTHGLIPALEALALKRDAEHTRPDGGSGDTRASKRAPEDESPPDGYL